MTTSPAMASKIELWALDQRESDLATSRPTPTTPAPTLTPDCPYCGVHVGTPDSVLEFGVNNPIRVDSKGGIVAGHGRLLAARKIGLQTVPVVVLDHLSEAQRRAYILPDNRLPNLPDGIRCRASRLCAWFQKNSGVADLLCPIFSLAQRRERVFVMACPADGADPTQVLFEFEGVPQLPCPAVLVPHAHNVLGGQTGDANKVETVRVSSSLPALLFTKKTLKFNGIFFANKNIEMCIAGKSTTATSATFIHGIHTKGECMNFDQMLAELGSILGFENFGKTEDGNVTASFDNIFVTLDYFDEHVYFLTKIADLPEDKMPAYTYLLEASSFGKLDGYVGITPEHSAIIFVTKIPAQLAHAPYVADRLEKHINAAEKLTNGLNAFSSPESENTAVLTDPIATGGFLKV